MKGAWKMKKWQLCIWVLVIFLLSMTKVTPGLAGEAAEPLGTDIKQGVELVDQRTEYSRTFLNPDGSTTVELSSDPLFYQNKIGLFAEVAPRLQTLQAKDQPTSFMVNQTIYQCSFGDAEEGLLFTYQDQSIRVKPLDIEKTVSGSMMGEVIHYERVWPHADLFYEIGADSVKERIMLYSTEASAQYRFHYTLPVGATISEVEGGLRIGVDGSKFSYFIPDPFVYDMATEAPSFDPIQCSYVVDGQECMIIYTLDQEWFHSNQRVFPVTIDPSLTLINESRNSYPLVFEANQRITVDVDFYMPAMTIAYAADRVKVKEGSKVLWQDLLWHKIFSANRKHVSKSFNVSANKEYYFERYRGNGWVPFRIIYGNVTTKITYFRKPVVVFGEDLKNKFITRFPNIFWSLKYQDLTDKNKRVDGAPQTKYKIAFSQNLEEIQSPGSSEDCRIFTVDSSESSFELDRDIPTDTPGRGALRQEGTWYYRVSGSNGGVWSDWSEIRSFYLDKEGPVFEQRDQGLLMTPLENNGVQVKWGEVTDDSEQDVEIQIGIALYPSISYVSPAQYTISEGQVQIQDLLDNQKYKIKIKALDKAGNNSIFIGDYVTPAAVTSIYEATFCPDDSGGYDPKIRFINNKSYAYKVKIFKLMNQQWQEDHVSPWIMGKDHNNSFIEYTAHELPVDRFTKYRFQVATANEELKAWADLTHSTAEDVEVPDAKPGKPISIYPQHGLMLKPKDGDKVILKATTVEDYEKDDLVYEIELYKKTGELPKTVDELANDPEFAAYCLPIFKEQYIDYLNGKISEEYDHDTVATLKEWSDIGLELGVIDEPIYTEPDDNTDPGDGDNNTDPGDGGGWKPGDPIIDPPGGGDITKLLADHPTTTAISSDDTEESISAETTNVDVAATNQIALSTAMLTDLLRSEYTFSEYKNLVYEIQHAYYYDSYMREVQTQVFSTYVLENYASESYEPVTSKEAVVDEKNGVITTTFTGLQERTYSWRVKVTEVNTRVADGNASYSDYFDFIVRNSGPMTPTFQLQNLSGQPIRATKQTDVRLGNIVYDPKETTRLTVSDTYHSEEKDITLGSRNYYNYKLRDLEGEQTVILKAYDSLGNSSQFSWTVLYDRTPPTNPVLTDFEMTESDQAVILKWESGTDLPISENVGHYEVTVTLTKTYFADSSRTKVFIINPKKGKDLELTINDLDYNEKVTFTLVTVDTAGNSSDPTEPMVGYTRPERSQILNPYDQAKQSIVTEGGLKKHKLALNVQAVGAAAYELYFEQIGGSDGSDHTSKSINRSWILDVKPNATYRCWVRTYNNLSDEGRGREAQYIDSEPVNIVIYNHAPSAPTITMPAFVGTDKVRLSYPAGIDDDGNPLTYYNKVTCDGNLVIDPEKTGETKALTYDLIGLVNGKTYSWQVGVWDDHEQNDFDERVIQYSNKVYFQVDLSKPIITVQPLPEERHMNVDQITVSASDSISGLATLNYTLRIPNTNDESGIIEESSISSGTTLRLLDGEYELVVTAVDQVGHEKNVSYLYRVDTSKPVIEKVEIHGTGSNQGDISETSMVEFEVQFAEDQSMLKGFYYALLPEGVNGTEKTEEELEWVAIDPAKVVPVKELGVRYRFTQTLHNKVPLESGKKHYLYVRVKNDAGLPGEKTSSESITVDTTIPTITEFNVTGLENGFGGVYLTDLTSLSVTCSATDPETGVKEIQYGIIKDEAIDWFTSLDALEMNWSYQDGDQLQIVVRVLNQLDNPAYQYSESFIVDFNDPLVSYVHGGNNPTLKEGETYSQKKNEELNLSWKMIDNTGIAKYEYKIGTSLNGHDVSDGISGADANGWVQVNSIAFEQQLAIPAIGEGFTDGTYYVTIRGTDLAGNQTLAPANPIVIDSSLPDSPEIIVNPYLNSETTLPIRLKYVGDVEITGYSWYLYEKNDQLIQVKADTITTGLKDYTGMIEYGFVQGKEYYLMATATLVGEIPTPEIWSFRILVDTTAPEITDFDVPAYSTSEKIQIRWVAQDLQFGPAGSNQGLQYQVKLGYSRGGSELQDWQPSLFNTYTFSDLEITDQETVYVTLRVANDAGLATEVYSEPITIDNSILAAPVITHGYGLYTANSDQLDFDWSATHIPEYLLDHYEVIVTRTPVVPENAKWTDVGKVTHYTHQAALVNGSPYYLSVRAYGKNGLYSEGISNVVVVDFTKPDMVKVDDRLMYSANTSTLSADYHAVELESEINYICYALGTRENPEEILSYTWEPYDPKNLTISATGNLKYGETYYFTIMVGNAVGLPSDFATSDGVGIVKANSPRVKVIDPGGTYTNDNTKLDFTWEVDDSTMPFKEFRYGLVSKKEDTPAKWFTTIEPKCTVTPDMFGGSDPAVFANGVYYLKVYSVNKLEYVTQTVTSEEVVLDAVIPDPPVIETGTVTGKIFNLRWSAGNVGISRIKEYHYGFGSYPGGTDLLDWQVIQHDQADYNSEQELTLLHKDIFYLTVKVKNRAGSWSIPAISNPILVDLEGPSKPEVGVPEFTTSYTLLSGVDLSSVDLESGVVKYRWQLIPAALKGTLTELKTSDQSIDPVVCEWHVSDLVLNTALTVDGNYYLAVQTWDGVGNKSEIGYGGPIIVDTTGPKLSLSPSDPDLVTNGEEMTVNWATNEPGELTYNIFLVDENEYKHLQEHGTSVVSSDQLSGSISFHQTVPGNYVVEVVQKDIYENESETKTLNLRVNHQPTVALSQSSTSLFKGHTFKDTVTASDQEDGTVTSYFWKVVKLEVDGSETWFYDGSGTATFSYEFKELGNYKVTVEVTDHDGGRGSDEMTVIVTNTTSGALKLSEIWTGTAMVVTADVVVPVGLTLTIEPGTEVRFAPETGLIVEGTLICQGTAAAGITLRSSRDQLGLWWNGVKLASKSTLGQPFSYVTVQGAKRGLTLVGQSAEIDHMTFDSNEVGLHLVGGMPQISDSIFRTNAKFGIKEDGGVVPTVLRCGFGSNGRADYYDEKWTWMTADELNSLPGNQGNYRLEGVVNP